MKPTFVMEEDWDNLIILDAYKKNLRKVIKQVKRLAKSIEGKIVITADHSELIEEKKFYGHGQPLLRHRKLVNIPLFEIENNNFE